jgi:hypothetical protein
MADCGFFLFFFFFFSSFFFFDMRGIIVYSCHLCYLFDGKVDEDLKIKVTINLDLKIIKLEIG